MVHQNSRKTRWVASFPRIPTGKRSTKTFRAKSAAKQFEAQQLAKWERFCAGTYDAIEEHLDTPIATHVADFIAAMETGALGKRKRRPPTSEYVATAKYRVEEIVKSMRVRRASEMSLEKLLTVLRTIEGGLAPSTRDKWGMVAKQFGRWLVKSGRLRTNPFEDFVESSSAADATVVRQAFLLADLKKLCEAAEVREVQQKRPTDPAVIAKLERTGRARAVLYQFACLTGMRSKECRTLTWSQVHLDEGFARVNPGVAKNRTNADLPLVPDLVAALRGEREAMSLWLGRPLAGGDLVFPLMPSKNNGMLPKTVRADAEFAGIPLVDEEGRTIDFHALRGSCATILFSQGVPPHIVQQIMRHSSLDLTMKHYVKTTRTDLQDAVKHITLDEKPEAGEERKHG